MKLIKYFKALSDETRLRICNILSYHELNVNEICSVMEMGQSRISRHLKILTDSGLLTIRRDGLWAFYRIAEYGSGREFLSAMEPFSKDDKSLFEDKNRLEKIIEKDSVEKIKFFNSLADDWHSIRKEIFGSFDVLEKIRPYIDTNDIIADLGCGTGHLIAEAESLCKKVIGVDKSERMIQKARENFSKNSIKADLRIGELDHLPILNSEIDLAIINMVIHYLQFPLKSIEESARIIKAGGALIIVDLEKHENEKMRIDYGHRWLGFSKGEMEKWLTDSGFRIENYSQFEVEQGLKINLFYSKRK